MHVFVVQAVDERWAAWLQQQIGVPWEAEHPILPHELARIHANHPNSTYLSGLRADPAEVQAAWEAHRRVFCPPAGSPPASSGQAELPLPPVLLFNSCPQHPNGRHSAENCRSRPRPVPLPPALSAAVSLTPSRCPRHPYAQHVVHECFLLRDVPTALSLVPPNPAACSRRCPVHHTPHLAHECRQLLSLYPSRSARLLSTCAARNSPPSPPPSFHARRWIRTGSSSHWSCREEGPGSSSSTRCRCGCT